MPTLFDRTLAAGDRLNYRHNGQQAVFAYNDLIDSAEITVIFERSKEIITLQGETEVAVRRPVASVQHEQLEQLGLPLPKKRDQLTIDSIVYDIAAVPDDGHNETEMHLEKE